MKINSILFSCSMNELENDDNENIKAQTIARVVYMDDSIL
jgi:hypothetical protein